MWVEKEQTNMTSLTEREDNKREGACNDNEGHWVGDMKCADKVLGFDVEKIPYTKEAYAAKKYAFVSDYARFWVLYKYGGVYFDTDVEVIKSMDDILERGAFMGFERDPDRWGVGLVNPGLGMAIEPHADIIKELISKYEGLHFQKEDGSMNIDKTIVHYTSEVLADLGMKQIKGIQELKEIILYPSEYFAPIDFITKRLHIKSNTHTIHRYMASWGERKNKGILEIIKHYMPEIFLVWINRIKHIRLD